MSAPFLYLLDGRWTFTPKLEPIAWWMGDKPFPNHQSWLTERNAMRKRGERIPPGAGLAALPEGFGLVALGPMASYAVPLSLLGPHQQMVEGVKMRTIGMRQFNELRAEQGLPPITGPTPPSAAGPASLGEASAADLAALRQAPDEVDPPLRPDLAPEPVTIRVPLPKPAPAPAPAPSVQVVEHRHVVELHLHFAPGAAELISGLLKERTDIQNKALGVVEQLLPTLLGAGRVDCDGPAAGELPELVGEGALGGEQDSDPPAA